MSAIGNTTRWEVKPDLREKGPYYAVAPDGTEHGPYEQWIGALSRASVGNHSIRECELTEQGDLVELVLLPLIQRGATRIQSEYSGSGDSGEFYELVVEGARATPEERSAIEAHFEELLEQRYAGWENNEGGNGEFTIDLTSEPVTVEHTHNECVEEYNTTSHSDELLLDVAGVSCSRPPLGV